jgi:POT family proton-dependent oligopeptide transporter
MLLASMAFGTMMLAGLSGGDTGLVSGYWLVGTYAILTTGELCLSPMGLSLVSKLAAPRQRSMWMGGWFVATAVGGYLSGAIGGFWNQWSHSTFFGFLACSSLVAMGIMLGFLRWLRNTMPPAK